MVGNHHHNPNYHLAWINQPLGIEGLSSSITATRP